MHFSLTVLALASAAGLSTAAPAPIPAPEEGVPFGDKITLQGDIQLDPSWRFDTDAASAVSTSLAQGVDYLYKCGTPSTKGPFNKEACAKMINPTNNIKGCADDNLDPFVNDGPKRCVADGSTGLTHFTSALAFNKEEVSGNSVSNACGWLGDRCGDDYDNAMLYILGPPGGKRSVDLNKDSFGMVKIYNNA